MSNQEKKDQVLSVFQKYPNRFLLAVAAGKRAKQLKEGAKPLVSINDDNRAKNVEIAIKELMDDQVKIMIKEPNTEEQDMLDDFDTLLDAELELEATEEKEEKKTKDRSKLKKSLAA